MKPEIMVAFASTGGLAGSASLMFAHTRSVQDRRCESRLNFGWTRPRCQTVTTQRGRDHQIHTVSPLSWTMGRSPRTYPSERTFAKRFTPAVASSIDARLGNLAVRVPMGGFRIA